MQYPNIRAKISKSVETLSGKKKLYIKIKALLSKRSYQLTCAISFFVQQKLIKERFTKSEPQQTVTVFSSRVSCEPIVTICRNFESFGIFEYLPVLVSRIVAMSSMSISCNMKESISLIPHTHMPHAPPITSSLIWSPQYILLCKPKEHPAEPCMSHKVSLLEKVIWTWP